MANNILDYGDARMEAKAKYDKFLKNFNKMWYGPLVDTSISVAWHRVPQEAKMLLKQNNPQEYEAMEKTYGNPIPSN